LAVVAASSEQELKTDRSLIIRLNSAVVAAINRERAGN
jgi:hypothetical protein